MLMEMEKESRFALLPAYLVLDTSASMGIDGAFDAAFEFLYLLLDEMNESSVISDKLRVEVITFDTTAEVIFPLGTRSQLARWLKEKQSNPTEPDGDGTCYSVAFSKLRSEIEKGVQQIRNERYEDEKYQVFRPVVFFITDGVPTDTDAERNTTFAELTDNAFKARPSIVCAGVREAKREMLGMYGAGSYKSANGKYMTKNGAMVLVAKDGVAPIAALRGIVSHLLHSLIGSLGSMSAASADDEEMPDIFEGNDDLWDNDDELDDVLDMED